ncbi:MAG: methyltransferase domain-containing protein [Nitrospira sp.]|nr:methyltransferase domain-containing protein [Nitrospira sp.]
MADDHKTGGFLSTQSAYDEWAEHYDDEDPTVLLDEPFLQSMLQPFAGCRILDLGCGTGRYLRLASRDAAVVGLDLSRNMLARARRQTSPRIGVQWVQGSVERMPFGSQIFDRIVSGLVLDHVGDLTAFFLGIAAALRPGGRAIVTAVHPEMQRKTGPTVRFTAAGREYRTEGTIHEKADILTAVQQAGLSIDQIEEPPVTEPLIARREVWRDRLGCPALLLLALTRGADHRHDH